MEMIPVATSKESPMWLTQIEGNDIENAGVIKMDFLGLKTLTVLKNALALIKLIHGVEIDLDKIPLDDKKTFELYQHGCLYYVQNLRVFLLHVKLYSIQN